MLHSQTIRIFNCMRCVLIILAYLSGVQYITGVGESTFFHDSEYSINNLQSNFTLDTPLTINNQQCILVNNQNLPELLPLDSVKNNSQASFLAETESIRNVRIILFVESRIFSLFINWLQHFKAICSDSGYAQLEVICMDNEVHDMISRQSLHCSAYSFLFPSGLKFIFQRQSLIWIKRMQISIQFLDQGFDVILSDIDAIWRKDPFPTLSRLSATSDIISSRGMFPSAISSKWGAALCMGFVYFRANRLVSLLLAEALNDMRSKEINLLKLIEISKFVEDLSDAIVNISLDGPGQSSTNLTGQSIENLVEYLNRYTKTDSRSIKIVSKNVDHQRYDTKQNVVSIEREIYLEHKNETLSKLKRDLKDIIDSEDYKPDDQWSLNHVLLRHGLQWMDQLSVDGNSIDQHAYLQWNSSQVVRVTLLSHKNFLRHCSSIAALNLNNANVAGRYSFQTILRQEVISHAYVAHCLTRPGPNQKKIKHLQAYGLWISPDPYHATSPTSDSLANGNKFSKLRKRSANSQRWGSGR